MKKNKVQIRQENIINYINNHQSCTTNELVKHISSLSKSTITKRTIQHDLKYLKEIWDGGELNSYAGQHHIKLNKNLSNQILEIEKKTYLKLALEAFEDLTDLSSCHGEITKELSLDKLSTPYYIKPEEYQVLNTDKEEIKELSNAIQQDHVIEFEFKKKFYHVEPYRLVNFDGIWYLYGRDIEEEKANDHKTWMLKHIDKVETYYNTKHDTTDEEIEEDLKDAHSADFIVDKEFNITVKVSSVIADIFREKNHLPKQKSTLLSDGSLQITSTISTYADVDPEIKSWLPYIEILEPLEYREMFLNELREYLNTQ